MNATKSEAGSGVLRHPTYQELLDDNRRLREKLRAAQQRIAKLERQVEELLRLVTRPVRRTHGAIWRPVFILPVGSWLLREDREDKFKKSIDSVVVHGPRPAIAVDWPQIPVLVHFD